MKDFACILVLLIVAASTSCSQSGSVISDTHAQVTPIVTPILTSTPPMQPEATARNQVRSSKTSSVDPTVLPSPTYTPGPAIQTSKNNQVDLSNVTILCKLDEMSKTVSCTIPDNIGGKQTWSTNASGQRSESRDFVVIIDRRLESVEIQLELCLTDNCETITKIVDLPSSFSGKRQSAGNSNTSRQGNIQGRMGNQKEDEPPPAIIKSLGYDHSSGVAPILVIDYGTLTHVSNRVAYNMQPTFVLPAGTKVTAIIDGVVCRIPELYSGDYSVMIAPSADQCLVPKYMWEMEHVINVIVKAGDSVLAGQTIAEVSDYSYKYGDPQGHQPRPDRKYGFDLVEIGLLEGGQEPRHHCPWLYIHPNHKDELLKVMVDLRLSIEAEPDGSSNAEYIRYFLAQHITDWETSTGKPEYNSAQYQAPSCKLTNLIGEDGLPLTK